jgi:hypothetical protein
LSLANHEPQRTGSIHPPRGERDPDIAPLMQIAPADLDSYKADSLQELLDALWA